MSGETTVVVGEDDASLPAELQHVRLITGIAKKVGEHHAALRSVWDSSGGEFPQFFASAIIEVNSLSKRCTPGSVLTSVLNAATLGLKFGKELGHVYLVPFKDQCQVIVGYQGFQALAFRSGFLARLETEVVLDGEEFSHWTDSDGCQVYHEMPIDRVPDPGGKNVQAAYCQYWTRTGERGVVVVPRSDIEKCKNPRADPWKFNYAAMARKTAVRRAAKYWNGSERLAKAVALDEAANVETRVQPSLVVHQEPQEDRREPSVDELMEMDVPDEQKLTAAVVAFCEGDSEGEFDSRLNQVDRDGAMYGFVQAVMSGAKNIETRIDSSAQQGHITPNFAGALRRLVSKVNGDD